MKFSQDFIERVQDANNILDIVSQYTQLKPMAGGFMGRCPFPDHQEKTPSFSVSETKQVYNCFGCHKKGNIFTFIQQLMGLSFPETIEYLANRAHITLPEKNDQDIEKQDQLSKKKKELFKANKLAAEYFYKQFQALPKTHPVKIYAFEKRGLHQDTINEFQIGYATEEWDGLAKYLEQHGISLQIAEEARLIKARPQGNGYYDIFRDRLMFPILNQMGEAVAFGGRIISHGEPKYLNSGETLVFNKSKILYGLYQTAKFVRSEDQCLIVEGYMDLVSLYQGGIKNVAATMGTALTTEHGKLLGRMTKNIAVLFDGDDAGIMAAERSLPILLSANLHPKGLILPDEMDPDDFVKKLGSENLKKLILNAADLFSMVLSIWTKNFRGEASEKIKLTDQLTPVFESIFDSRLKNLYIEEAASKLRVDQSWLIQALKQKKSTQNANQNQKVERLEKKYLKADSKMMPDNSQYSSINISLKGLSKPEGILLGLSLKSINNFNKLIESKIIEKITHEGVRSLLEKAAFHYGQEPDKFDKLAGLFATYVDRPEFLFPPQLQKLSMVESEATDVASSESNEQEVRLLSDCIQRIRENHLKSLIDQLAQEVKKDFDPQKVEQFMSLKRELLALKSE